MALKPQILIVDDNAQLLRSLQVVLRRDTARWDISFVLGGDEAMRHLLERTFDVVISDFDMGSIKGSDVLALAEERSPAALRIMLTARDEFAAWQVHAHALLVKPCSFESLRGLIELHVARRDDTST